MEITDEELERVHAALHALRMGDAKWQKNFDVYHNMNSDQRYRWWYRMKQQVGKGAAAPDAIVQKMIYLRLTS